ncbi:MAG: type II toxin-antitoxin system RelB family antitoxin [Gulosibacter sp.]|uniref:type II toxin-antitoxin system RelB family antitoxin n=1 Tax=Gulosibacter sp. TaxID=2817531 RepID=UPI003F8DE4FE
MATKQLNIRLDEKLDQRLEALAARTGRSKAFYASEAIEAFLDDWEDYYLAKDALTEFRDSDETAIDVEDVDWNKLGA